MDDVRSSAVLDSAISTVCSTYKQVQKAFIGNETAHLQQKEIVV